MLQGEGEERRGADLLTPTTHKAVGASGGQIQAMCKGVSEQSLHMYARMHETTYTCWVCQALDAKVDFTHTISLMAQGPRTDDVTSLQGF